MLYILKSKKVIAWIIVIVITLGFIFGQSLLSRSESLDKSRSVLHFFENLFKQKEDSKDDLDISGSADGKVENNESLDGGPNDESEDGEIGGSQENANGSVIPDNSENNEVSEDKENEKNEPETKKPRPFNQFLKKNFRKIAHFVEHGVLGLEVFFLAFVIEKHIKKRRKILPLNVSTLLLVLNTGFIVSFLDESIQILSGRGPSVRDMWIDIAGYTSFTALCFIVTLIVKSVNLVFINKNSNASVK